ncbi:MAG TPA: hypothetical protein VIU61_19865 [Kofleriaceae bacterium]
MARILSILVLAIVVGCGPSLKDRARSLGSNVASLGSRVAKVVTPKTPTVSVDVKAVVVAVAKDRAHHAVATRVAGQEPITFRKTVRRTPTEQPSVQPQPVDQPTVQPTVTVDRVDASRPTKFVLRSQTAGGKSQCEAYDTMESCTASCTSMQRPQMFDAKAPKVTCSCMEQDGGC